VIKRICIIHILRTYEIVILCTNSTYHSRYRLRKFWFFLLLDNPPYSLPSYPRRPRGNRVPCFFNLFAKMYLISSEFVTWGRELTVASFNCRFISFNASEKCETVKWFNLCRQWRNNLSLELYMRRNVSGNRKTRIWHWGISSVLHKITVEYTNILRFAVTARTVVSELMTLN